MSVAKKKGEGEIKERAKFGRTNTHNLSMGIVGLPNVGKSSLFNVMTGLQVPASNYAFCTIDPCEAKVSIKDKRFDDLCALFKPKREVPSYLSVFDIAGLVKGASEGLGMGNSFLEHIRQVDGIFHVVRCFKDDSVVHVENTVDPARDCETIRSELRKKDLADSEKREAMAARELRGKPNDKQLKIYAEALEKLVSGLKDGKDARYIEFTSDEIKSLRPLNLITAKNVVYLANIGQDRYVQAKAPALAIELKKHLIPTDPEAPLVLFSASVVGEDALKYVEKIIDAGYKSLDLSNFFTCGPDEVRSWVIREGTLAPDAGAVIHTDFKTGFVAVDVMKYDDLMKHGSEQEVKSKGLCNMRGRDYSVVNGDVLHFKAGRVNAGKK